FDRGRGRARCARAGIAAGGCGVGQALDTRARAGARVIAAELRRDRGAREAWRADRRRAVTFFLARTGLRPGPAREPHVRATRVWMDGGDFRRIIPVSFASYRFAPNLGENASLCPHWRQIGCQHSRAWPCVRGARSACPDQATGSCAMPLFPRGRAGQALRRRGKPMGGARPAGGSDFVYRCCLVLCTAAITVLGATVPDVQGSGAQALPTATPAAPPPPTPAITTV